jgi:hypothetical protein
MSVRPFDRNRAPWLVAALLAAFAAASPAFAGDPPAAPAPSAPPSLPTPPAKLAELMKSKDKAERLDAATKAKDDPSDLLTSPLTALLDDEELAVRTAAIDALAARSTLEAKRKAASALGARLSKLAKHADAQSELIAAIEALGTLGQPSTVSTLLADIALDTPLDVVRARLMAVANAPCAEAIDGLITFLAKQGRGQMGQERQACRAALKSATGQDLGGDPDAWRAWWKDAKKDFDFDAAARRRDSAKAAEDDKEKRKKERKDKKDGDGGDKKKDGGDK